MKPTPSNPLLFFAFLFFALTFTNTTHAQELSYYPGMLSVSYYQDHVRITQKEFKGLLAQHEASLKNWNTGTGFEVAGLLAAGGSGFLLGTGLAKDDLGEEATGFYVGGAVAFVVSGILVEIAKNKKRKAVLDYNEQLETRTAFKLEPSRKGVGVALRF
ncbi:hypothetical protein OZ410_13940 [Robiginitalea sp. M366]|uniref:hypothetical protein n=1 Tax=Robiginitalea aestuariiviva TaxID=3036903 RepID=UPI00240CF6DC|nr:hypothetical protein [Robiginitalea aestuariiviva]MDG1573426.1 hypothetical protein [Robiginitalea aestuariiviva]